jgi:hypothetical protein
VARNEFDLGMAASYMTKCMCHVLVAGVNDVGTYLQAIGYVIKPEGVQYANRDRCIALVGIVPAVHD